MVDIEKIALAFEDCELDYLTEDNYRDKVINRMVKNLDLDYDSGASKLVIIPDEEDYVIKIPFQGSYPEYFENELPDWVEWDDDYCIYIDKRTGEEVSENVLIEDGELTFVPFNIEDHCREEASVYELAVEYSEEHEIDITPLFAQTKELIKINGMPIYYQPKCETGIEKPATKKELQKVEKSMISQGYCIAISLEWLIDVKNVYGDEILYGLLDFIEYYGVDDLHDSNIGHRNGKPILFDYSGFSS